MANCETNGHIWGSDGLCVFCNIPKVTAFQCPMEASKGTCEPFDDPRSHDFQGWMEFDEGRGGTTVCTRCGITSFAHAMRYAP